MNKQLFFVAMTLPLFLFGTGTVFANTNANKEISAAYTHAEYASKATDISKVDLHLHHIINCLVGTQGVGFDKSAGDPCMNMGMGAITDFNYKVADKVRRDMLKSALEDANYGLMTHNLKIAHNAADLAAKDLKKAQEDL